MFSDSLVTFLSYRTGLFNEPDAIFSGLDLSKMLGPYMHKLIRHFSHFLLVLVGNMCRF